MDAKEYGKIKKMMNKGKYILNDEEQIAYDNMRKKITDSMAKLDDMEKDFFENIEKKREDKIRKEKEKNDKPKYARLAGEYIFKLSGAKYLDDKFVKELKWTLENYMDFNKTFKELFKKASDGIKAKKENKKIEKTEIEEKKEGGIVSFHFS